MHLMNPMIPGLTGIKMSSSILDSKIDILDSSHDIQSKISRAYAKEGVKDNNSILAFTKFVLFRLIKDKFVIDRLEKFGGPLEYSSYATLEIDYVNRVLHPQDLKSAMSKYLNLILAPIRAEYFSDVAIQKIAQKAYPSDAVSIQNHDI